MLKAKYDELKQASDRSNQLFEEYEANCRRFIGEFRERLIDYLGCPEDRVRWLPLEVSEEQRRINEIIETTLGNRMALQKDAFYLFAFRVTFDSTWIDLPLKVRKNDEHFVVKIGKREQRIREDSREIDEFVEHIFNVAKEYIEKRFDDFIHGKPSTLGFEVS